jgi:hypothetical protein
MLLQDPNNLLFTETAHLHCLSPQVENRLPQMPDSSGQQVITDMRREVLVWADQRMKSPAAMLTAPLSSRTQSAAPSPS